MPLSLQQRRSNMMNLISSSSSGGRYLALSSTQPNADGTGVTEPSGNGYARISMRYNIIGSENLNFPSTPTYDDVTDTYSIANILDMYFREATGSWGTLGYFAIYDLPTGGTGTMLAYGALTNTISPTANTIPVIRVGQLVIKEEESN